ncbi:MAG TPA: response regulator [Steroidobacteraceae bacterium]
MSISPTFVYVVDDDAGVRGSLERLFRVLGFQPHSFNAGKAFLDACPELQPGCVFTDLNMPGMSGLELLQRLRAADCHWPVVILTAFGSAANAEKSMRAGALAFLQKPPRQNELLAAVKRAQAYLNPDPQPVCDQEIAQRIQRLSPREREVLDGILEGLLNKQIAALLQISLSTVKSARNALMARLGVKTKVELVAMALRGGLKMKGGSR